MQKEEEEEERSEKSQIERQERDGILHFSYKTTRLPNCNIFKTTLITCSSTTDSQITSHCLIA
jgi:hypothetical protein